MDEHEYNVQKALLLDLYWNGEITFPQYLEQLTLLEVNYCFDLSD